MRKLIEKLSNLCKKAENTDNKGFTLVELVIVVLILGILTFVGFQGYTKYIGQAKVNTDKTSCETLKSVVINATAENGVYEELLALNGDSETISWVTNKDGKASSNGTDTITSLKSKAGASTKFPVLLDKVDNALADDIPAPKQDGKKFELTLTAGANDGTVKVKVEVKDAP